MEMLLDDAGGILHRHVVIRERHHASAQAQMQCVEGRVLEFAPRLRFRHHASRSAGGVLVRSESTSSRAAFTSSSRLTGARCGAPLTRAGSLCASCAILFIASMKASSVGLDSVSVGSIIKASGTISGK